MRKHENLSSNSQNPCKPIMDTHTHEHTHAGQTQASPRSLLASEPMQKGQLELHETLSQKIKAINHKIFFKIKPLVVLNKIKTELQRKERSVCKNQVHFYTMVKLAEHWLLILNVTEKVLLIKMSLTYIRQLHKIDEPLHGKLKILHGKGCSMPQMSVSEFDRCWFFSY